MKACTRILSLLSSALPLCVAAPAFAQEQGAVAPDREAAEFGDIVVTARRYEERLQDVPISITVFNQQQITNRNIVNPSDLATYTPSLSANRQYGTEKSSFSIRGFVQELGTQPSVAVYFADVVAPRAQGPTTSGNGMMPGTLFDLQNVQVLKGPQGTLFGRNTTGGAVLLVPQRPTDKLEGYVEGSYGNHDMKRVQAVANIPLADTFKLRLGVDRMVRDGYLHNQSGVGPDDFANVNYWGARASILGDLTPTLENYMVATYNRSRTRGTLPRVVACARPALPTQFLAGFGCAQVDRQTDRGDGYYDVENNIPDPQILLEQWQVINTTTWQASDTLTVKNIASYAEFREKTRINLFGDNLVISPTAAFQLAAIEPGPTGNNAAQSTFTEELQLQGRSGDGSFTWQAGGYIELSNPLKTNTQLSQLYLTCTDTAAFQCTAPITPFGIVGSVSLIDQRYRFRNIAGYAQGTYRFTEQLSVTAGIRYTSDRTQAVARNAVRNFSPFAPAPIACSRSAVPLSSFAARDLCAETFVTKSSRPTWLIDLEYKPAADVLLYAKYARGYRQGVINLLPRTPSLGRTGPEKVDTYEIGAKTGFRGAISGTFNLAAFYNDFTNQQIQGNLTPRGPEFPTNVLLNAGKSRIWGVEAEASVRVLEAFRLDLAYAYLNTKLRSLTKPDFTNDTFYRDVDLTAVVGGPLAYSPKHRVSATGTYTLPLDESLGAVSLSATYTYTSKQFGSHVDDRYVPQFGFNPGILPATHLVNVNLNWDSAGGLPIDLSAFATNLTKRKYHVAIGGVGGAGYESVIVGEPRMYGVRLRYRFGE